jgi:hypothetical protein
LEPRPRIARSDSSTSLGEHTSTASHPASRCTSIRAFTPPTENAAAMPMSSENTTPRKPISSRSTVLIQNGE